VKKLLALSAALVAALAIGLAPAGAITNGTPDGDGHPYVGLVTFYDEDGVYLWRCSATLMSPTILLTAGHCTEAPAESAQVWFDTGPIPAGVYPLAPIEDRPPCTGYTGWPCEGGDATGTPYTHPQYNPNAFFLFDLGVVELDAAVTDPSVTAKGFGALPPRGVLSELGKHTSMTAVGYGLQRRFPPSAAWKNEGIRIRMVATPRIKSIDAGFVGDFAFETSFDASGGGTCSGDSGGPNFIGATNVVGGVTSFGTTDPCKGHNGAYRIDQPDDLAWLATFGLTP
jgi:hypothetical protein